MTWTEITTNTGQSDSDNSIPVVLASDQMQPDVAGDVLPVRAVSTNAWRANFAKTVTGGVDPQYWELIKSGAGQSVNQANNLLVISAGITANAETIIRSKDQIQTSFIMRGITALSQRIANQTFVIELVDVIGDNLSATIDSATAVTVTIPNNPFTGGNVGQSMTLGGYTGTGTFVSGVYPITAVNGDDVTYNVTGAGFSAGSGTCSVFGWNAHTFLYQGTNTYSCEYSTMRRGWPGGTASGTQINGTGSSGHYWQFQSDETNSVFIDGTANAAGRPTTFRFRKNLMLPMFDTALRLQIRARNNATAPASSTTMTFQFMSLEKDVPLPVAIAGGKKVDDEATMNIGVTQLGAVSTLYDGMATPAIGQIGSIPLLANANTFDRQRTNYQATIAGDQGTKAATFNGATQTNYGKEGMLAHIRLGAVSGATPSLKVQLQASADGGTNWFNYGTETSELTATNQTLVFVCSPHSFRDVTADTVLTTGATVTKILNAPLPRNWRFTYTINGSFAISAVNVIHLT